MLLLLQSATDTQSIEVMSCEFNTERREALKTPLALFETVSENVDRAVVCSRGEIGGWNDRWNVEPCSDGDTESDGSSDSERSFCDKTCSKLRPFGATFPSPRYRKKNPGFGPGTVRSLQVAVQNLPQFQGRIESFAMQGAS